jgi:phosphatidate cytidylyltransferase
MASNMTKRVGFAVIAIPVLVGAIWYGTWPLAFVLAVTSVLAVRELFTMANRAGVRPYTASAVVVAVGVPLSFCLAVATGTFSRPLHDWWPMLMLAVALCVIGQAVFLSKPTERPLAAVAVTLFAMIYVVVLPSMLFFIRHALWSERSWAGTAVAFLPLIVTWVCDTAAMLGGGMIGGAKLAPAISPGKTRSGALCGVVGGAAAGAAYGAVILPPAGIHVAIVWWALFAAVLAIVGQVGDLAESLFKREAGVKDSSTLIPGHGGVLDRLDSLYFVLPAAAIGYHLLGVL